MINGPYCGMFLLMTQFNIDEILKKMKETVPDAPVENHGVQTHISGTIIYQV